MCKLLTKAKKSIKLQIDTVKNFKNNPIDSLAIIFLFFSVTVSLIGFIVALIIFVVKGGYSEQLELIQKLDFFSGAEEALTSGTVNIIYNGIVAAIIKFALCSEIIFMLIAFFIRETKPKKILMIIDLSLLVILTVLYVLFDAINTRKITLTEKQEAAILKFFNGVTINNISILFIAFFSILLVVLVIFLILTLKSDGSWMLKYSCASAIISFGLMPIILLLIENIIPLVSLILGAVIFGVIFIFVIKAVLSGENSDSSSDDGIGKGKISSSNTKATNKPKEPQQRRKVYDLDSCFWRDKGGYGIAVPTADCIYVKNRWGEKTYVCTVSDYEKGKVVIINKNVRITDIAGCKTPIR